MKIVRFLSFIVILPELQSSDVRLAKLKILLGVAMYLRCLCPTLQIIISWENDEITSLIVKKDFFFQL